MLLCAGETMTDIQDLKEIESTLHSLDNHKCPECGTDLIKSKTHTGMNSKWFYDCRNALCSTIVNLDFEPTTYQLEFLADDQSQITGYFGGYGAGKSASSALKFLIHVLTVPFGEGVFGSSDWTLIYRACIKELNEVVPERLLYKLDFSSSPQSPKWQGLFRNGFLAYARVMVSEGDFRSANLTAYWIEEASEVGYSMFNQLNTRLRSDAGRVYVQNPDGTYERENYVDTEGIMRTRRKELAPRYLGIVSSNPDPGWIRTELVFKTPTNKVHYYGDRDDIRRQLFIEQDNKNPYYSTYVVSTKANYHLPVDFIPKNSAGKTQAWIDRYIEGSFSFAEGLVYPQYATCEVEPFEIPARWKRLISADFGRREATAFIVGAIDPENDILYAYDEYYMPGGDVGDWVNGFWKLYKPVNPTSWLMPPIGDPAGQSSGQADSKSWFELYADHGINFIPSNTGKSSEMGIAAGIGLVSEYMSAGKFKYFSTMKNFKSEISNYKYKTSSLMESTVDGKITEKPVAYNDHLMDALRGLISMLPKNVNQKLSSFNPMYVNNTKAYKDYESFENNNVYSPEFWSSGNKLWNNDDQYNDPYAFDTTGEISDDWSGGF